MTDEQAKEIVERLKDQETSLWALNREQEKQTDVLRGIRLALYMFLGVFLGTILNPIFGELLNRFWP